MLTIVEKTFKDCISYSHTLPKHYADCKKIHGHNATLKVQISGKLNPLISDTEISENNYPGMILDFKILKDIVRSIINYFDHTYLNESLPAFINSAIDIAMKSKINHFDFNTFITNLQLIKDHPPTCEVMANVIFIGLAIKLQIHCLNNQMDRYSIVLESIELSETESSKVIIRKG